MEVGDRRGSAEAVADLALTACCRRKALLAYFGEKRGRCQPSEELCDFCRDPKAVVGLHTDTAYIGQDTPLAMIVGARLVWASSAICLPNKHMS